jgi:hypothetical protein
MRIWLGLVLSLVVGCEKEKPKPPPPPATPSSSSEEIVAPVPSVSSKERDETVAPVDAGTFAIGAVSDIGPAGPATASAYGVVMVSKSDDVYVAAPGTGRGGTFKPIQIGAGSFSEVDRGPAVAGEWAYFISKGSLLRRRVEAKGPPETLAHGARNGTRVAAVAATADRPAAAAFVGVTEKSDSIAMLWVEGSEPMRVSPDGSGASSITMSANANGFLIASAEGRTGMTPVHTRQVKLEGKKPQLEEDVVVWVAGPAQPTTELALVPHGRDWWIFVPLERDVTRFGLAQVALGSTPKMASPVSWRAFPNGMDPSPLAGTVACEKELVVYARPVEAKPSSPQELQLAELGANGLGPADVVARAPKFESASITALADALLVAYVANGRTWALTLPCPGAKKDKKKK